MSKFYGSMIGARGEVTRTGTASSGISAHVRGWDSGVRVDMLESVDGSERACVEITSGSNGGPSSHTFIESVELDDIRAGRSRLAVVSTKQAVCNCIRGENKDCGYCGGHGEIEQGTDGQPAGPCHCCGPYDFNKIRQPLG
jgi:hypothetical protein